MPLIFCNSRCVYLGKIVPLETLTLDCFSSTSVQKEPNNAGCGYRSESKGPDIQLRVGECFLKIGVDTILMWQTNEEEEARCVAEKCRQGVSYEIAPVDFFSFWAAWDHLGHSYLFSAVVEFSQKMMPSFSSSFRCDTDTFLTCVCVCVSEFDGSSLQDWPCVVQQPLPICLPHLFRPIQYVRDATGSGNKKENWQLTPN